MNDHLELPAGLTVGGNRVRVWPRVFYPAQFVITNGNASRLNHAALWDRPGEQGEGNYWPSYGSAILFCLEHADQEEFRPKQSDSSKDVKMKFSEQNRQRCESPRGFNHALSSWSLSDWMTAVAGELGEAANIIKKLNRVRDGIPGNTESEYELRSNLADEIADTAIYLDLLTQAAGFDLNAIVESKFLRTSDKIGYTAHSEPAGEMRDQISQLQTDLAQSGPPGGIVPRRVQPEDGKCSSHFYIFRWPGTSKWFSANDDSAFVAGYEYIDFGPVDKLFEIAEQGQQQLAQQAEETK